MTPTYEQRKQDWKDFNKDCSFQEMLTRFNSSCLTPNEFHAWLDSQMEKD